MIYISFSPNPILHLSRAQTRYSGSVVRYETVQSPQDVPNWCRAVLPRPALAFAPSPCIQRGTSDFSHFKLVDHQLHDPILHKRRFTRSQCSPSSSLGISTGIIKVSQGVLRSAGGVLVKPVFLLLRGCLHLCLVVELD
jgi:hypothetical protein